MRQTLYKHNFKLKHDARFLKKKTNIWLNYEIIINLIAT